MPSPDARRTDTRQRLVRCAARLFAQNGYGATTVSQIEGAVGLRPGSGAMYRHFPSKDALLLAAVTDYRHRVADLRRRLAAEADASSTPAVAVDARLRDLVAALAEFLSGEQAVLSLTVDSSALPDDARRVIGQAWDEAYAMVADVFVDGGMPRGEATVLSIAAVGSLHQYVSHLGAWREPPAGVPLAEYYASWVKLWSAVARTDRRSSAG